MGKRSKNRRRSGKKPLKKGKKVVSEQEKVVGHYRKRTTGKLSLPKSILIVCEGETEAAYFFALKGFLDRRLTIGVEVLPDLDAQEKSSGSGVSALSKLIEIALSKMQVKDYSEVWIVVDNDEDNAYKLDDASIDRIKAEDSTWAVALKTQQNKPLQVREKEKKKEKIRYFLHQSAYERFLSTTLSGLTEANYRRIIELTTKKRDFERFEDAPVAFFEKYKGASLSKRERKDLNRIKVAFTAIAFEHWLLLHYEYNEASFYNSREYYPYFDEKEYLTYKSGNQKNFFKKGYLLYEKQTQFRAFFEQAETKAIPNTLFLQNAYATPRLNQGLSYYEINPYCDVFHLVGSLIDTAFLSLETDYQIKTSDDLEKDLLKDLRLSRTETQLQLSFQLVYKQALSAKKIESSLSFIVYPQEGPVRASVPTKIEFNNTLYRKGDQVAMAFDLAPLQQGESCCFYINLKELYGDKGKQLCYFFIA